MRVFFGIILGIIITVGGAYLHDMGIPATAPAITAPVTTDPSQPSPPVPIPPVDVTQRRIVNWEVVDALTSDATTFVRDQWNKIFH
jgi:hypothetical protein